MNRLISILVTLFVIFLVYIWINNVMSNRDDATLDETSSAISAKQNSDQKTLVMNDEAVDGKTDSELVANENTMPAEDSEEAEEPPIAIPVNHKPAPKPTATKTANQTQNKPSAPKKVANAAQMHMVIAGNFSKRSNAENRLKELQQNGYKNAEIVNFDLSEYYTVCAGRFSDLMEAKRIAKKVRDFLNIEAYVRVGKE